MKGTPPASIGRKIWNGKKEAGGRKSGVPQLLTTGIKIA